MNSESVCKTELTGFSNGLDERCEKRIGPERLKVCLEHINDAHSFNRYGNHGKWLSLGKNSLVFIRYTF